MKIKHFTGFMLGNPDCPHTAGTQWMTYDDRVWVCPNLSKAKRVLQASHEKVLEPHCVWTTIYQVSAHDITFEQANNGLLYTNTPTKIFVDRVAYRRAPDVLTEGQLTANARKIGKKLSQMTENVR